MELELRKMQLRFKLTKTARKASKMINTGPHANIYNDNSKIIFEASLLLHECVQGCRFMRCKNNVLQYRCACQLKIYPQYWSGCVNLMSSINIVTYNLGVQ